MEANIIQRPKENFRSTFGDIKIHISIKTFVIAAFESKNRKTTYINETKSQQVKLREP